MHHASSHARRTSGTSFVAASVQQLSQKATRSSSHNVLAKDSTWGAASKLQLNPVTVASRSSVLPAALRAALLSMQRVAGQ